ncbi:MAG: hypothetical protein Q7R81_04320 [Candidatus Peregrinibacteria bacterium]|nr:hypothetical protein [Candidatus Peregrinibacteria bacterium]
MSYRDLEPLSKQLTIVVGLTVVGFMAFGLALSFYRNVLFEGTLANLRLQNDKLRERNVFAQQDLSYYRSAQYKDKYAKENFGKLRPGEKILIITEETNPRFEDSVDEPTISQEQEAAFEEYLRATPVIDHWKLYLFERKKIDELKRSL